MELDENLQTQVDRTAGGYAVSQPPIDDIFGRIRQRRRHRRAALAGAAAMVTVVGSVAAVTLLDEESSKPTPQSAAQECVPRVIQAQDVPDDRYEATVTEPNCDTFTVSGAQKTGTWTDVLPTQLDHTVLLIEGNDLRQVVKLRNEKTGEMRTLYEHDGIIREALLSPDGTQLAVEANGIPEDGKGHLAVVDLSSGSVARAPETLYSQRPEWSPDGAQIVYVTASTKDRPTDSRVTVLDVATNKATTISAFTLTSPDHPVWSPDGQSIAATGLDTAQGPADDGQYVQSLETVNLKTQTDNVASPQVEAEVGNQAVVDISWTNDELTVVSWEESGQAIRTMTVDKKLSRVVREKAIPDVEQQLG